MLDEGRPVERGQGPLGRAGRVALRRSAAAALHRPRAGGAAEGAPHGRTVFRARPDLDQPNRGDDPRHRRRGDRDHRDPQHAAGAAGLRHVRLLPRCRGKARTRRRVGARPRRCSPTLRIRGRRTTCTGASDDDPAPPGLRAWPPSSWQAWSGYSGAIVSGVGPAGATDPQLNSTGSSFAGVAISQWEGQFNELDGGNINFTVSSSIIGMNDFCNKHGRFRRHRHLLRHRAGGLLHQPGALPVPVHARRRRWSGLRVQPPGRERPTDHEPHPQRSDTARDLHRLHQELERPGHPGAEPGRAAAEQPITAYYRSDPSGENYLLSDYFLHVDPGPITAFQTEAAVPTPAGHAVGHVGLFQQRRPATT